MHLQAKECQRLLANHQKLGFPQRFQREHGPSNTLDFEPPELRDHKFLLFKATQGFPGGAVIKNPPANAGDTDSSPGPGRSHMPWSN